MKIHLRIIFIALFSVLLVQAQNQQNARITTIQNNLEVLSVDNKGLTEKLNINIQNTTLSNFLLAVSQVHKVNINVAPDLAGVNIVNNFSNVTVSDLLLFLCSEYQLDIDFIGNILSVKKYVAPEVKPVEREINVVFDIGTNTISVDLQNDQLEKSFRKIMDVSSKNILWSAGMENLQLTSYLKQVPFDKAMENIALTNNLTLTKSRDGFYLFESATIGNQNQVGNQTSQGQRPQRQRMSNFFFKVLDKEKMMLEVDFDNTPISNIINDIGNELGIDIFTATPLSSAGDASFKAKNINFDALLIDIFSSAANGSSVNQENNRQNTNQPNQQQSSSLNNEVFTFKKEGSIYYFGTANQLTVRNVEIIPVRHRSIEILSDPAGGASRSVGRTFTSPNGFQNFFGGGGNQGFGNNGFNNQNSFGNNQGFNSNNNFQNGVNNRRQTSFNNNSSSFSTPSQSLIDIIPDDVKDGLDIRTDFELNSFIVSGPSQNINRFNTFVRSIDKPVPVILIEVMIIEINRSASIETGIEWGIGEEAVETRGNVFPNTDITFGAKTINKVIGGFSGLGNLGQVVPEFFARLKAMESNGNIKIRSTPKMATLNGHKANFSSGTTTYYAITSRNIFGTDNPQSSEIRNYVPIDAELGLTIKPIVSTDGQVTLDVFVIQSDFNGERIEEDAPPGINSREFSSIIRVRDQDLVVLGGLEERTKNDSGSGVPFLARIPVIKWLFSKRRREDSRRKLTVLIKPTIIK